jgi:hypothetical protein
LDINQQAVAKEERGRYVIVFHESTLGMEEVMMDCEVYAVMVKLTL